MAPPTLVVSATWPVHRRLVGDLALAGAAVGAVAGVLTRHAVLGVALMIVGVAAGSMAGWRLGPRRYRLVLDEGGITVGRLLGQGRIPWSEVAAFGRDEGWYGRRGRSVGLAICRRGEPRPVPVRALTWHASGFRVGAARPEEVLAPFGEQALEPVRDWAAHRDVPVVEDHVADWWDSRQHVDW